MALRRFRRDGSFPQPTDAAGNGAIMRADLLHDLLHGAGPEALGEVAATRNLVRSGGCVCDT